MKPFEIKKDVFWVGGIDWDLRNFHGYLTQRGSTYNSYLIIDKKIVLVDTVKHYLYDEMLERIKKVIDPSKIDYIISNHVEMDHSGSLPKILDIAKNAVVITSPNGEKGLKRHYKKDWNFKVVNSGDSINIGKRNLNFVLAQMVHWPDSMVTYIPEDKLLLSNDAFGQHIASKERYDDEIGWDIVKEESKKYYANIVLPYGAQVNKLLESASGLSLDMIAPSHGLIWRKNINNIIEEYKKWANNKTENKAVIIYDTMWGSTEKITYAIKDIFEDNNILVNIKNLKTNHISDIMTDIIDSKYICIGSPALNNNVLPTISSFLTYLKGLSPKNRIGLAFGSYGWAPASINEIEKIINELKWQKLTDSIKINYIPDNNELNEVKNLVNNALKTGGQ